MREAKSASRIADSAFRPDGGSKSRLQANAQRVVGNGALSMAAANLATAMRRLG